MQIVVAEAVQFRHILSREIDPCTRHDRNGIWLVVKVICSHKMLIIERVYFGNVWLALILSADVTCCTL